MAIFSIHKFWQKRGIINYVLFPLSLLWYIGGVIRGIKAKPYRSSLFVVCLGNLNLGGSGKTPSAIMVGKQLKNRGYKVAFLTKGYGGKLRGPLWLNEDAKANEVGDEALLLGRHLPTLMAKNLKEGLRELEESKSFQIIIIDDGLQNPNIKKDFNIVVVNGAYGFGNGFLFPMGALRQSIGSGLQKANAMIILEKDEKDLKGLARYYELDVFEGRYKAFDYEILRGKEVFAFCGIGIPEKFLRTLETYEIKVRKFKAYSDHYEYKDFEIEILIDEAKKNNMLLLTTEKDYVKISAKYQRDIMSLKIEAVLDKESDFLSNLIKKLPKHIE